MYAHALPHGLPSCLIVSHYTQILVYQVLVHASAGANKCWCTQVLVSASAGSSLQVRSSAGSPFSIQWLPSRIRQNNRSSGHLARNVGISSDDDCGIICLFYTNRGSAGYSNKKQGFLDAVLLRQCCEILKKFCIHCKCRLIAVFFGILGCRNACPTIDAH